MELLTARELRHTLKISRTTLYRLLQQGLPSVGAGRLRRFALDDVIRWLNVHTGGQPSNAITLYQAGIYNCTSCHRLFTYKQPFPSDKFYCVDCFTRTLEWVGTPWAEPARESSS